MGEYYDRYKRFRNNGQVDIIPNIKISEAETDIYITYEKSKMRLDNLSYKYYGDSNYAWLILLSNPKYACMEFELKDGVTLRIPYPLNDALSRYDTEITNCIS